MLADSRVAEGRIAKGHRRSFLGNRGTETLRSWVTKRDVRQRVVTPSLLAAIAFVAVALCMLAAVHPTFPGDTTLLSEVQGIENIAWRVTMFTVTDIGGGWVALAAAALLAIVLFKLRRYDHRVVREGLQMALEIEEDIEVVGEAGEGREAVEKAQQLKPDLILMDVMMPGMNGIDACQEIRELLPETRVVMLTATGDQESVTAALVAGAQGYVLKAASRDELLSPGMPSQLCGPGQSVSYRCTIRK